MATFKVSGLLEVVFEDVEIEADSKEEALKKLYKKDVVDIIDECCIKESDIKEEEAELTDARLTFKVSNIQYDISEDDLGDIDEDDLRSNGPEYYIRKIKEGLPKELFFTIEYGIDFEDESDIQDVLADLISDETGWCVDTFRYEINPEQEEIYNYIRGI